MKKVRLATLGIILALGALIWVAWTPIGDPPEVGDPAPEFTLVSNEGTEVNLTDYRDQWIVLYFYPRDFTRGCTIQARNFQRDLEKYEEINAVILGVSVDSAESHKDFCAKEGLTFKLLSDSEAIVSEEYGSLRGVGEVKMSARNTFVIDPEGVVAKVYIGVNPNPHSTEVLADLAELQQSDD
ncbi:MAG: peroxiredoxin [Rhodothermia bacterium]|nr:MAG: peroxiredoxin [Rhodothermia bacterium]